MDHLTTNLRILDHLSRYLRANPEVPFCRALVAMCICEEIREDGIPIAWINKFYESSVTTLGRILSGDECLTQKEWIDITTDISSSPEP